VDGRFVDAPPAGADAWRDVWEHDRRYRPGKGRHGWIVALFNRFIGRAAAPELDRQRDFNVSLLDLLADLRRELDALRRDFASDIAAVQQDVRAADEALAGDLRATRELIPIAAQRNDALIAALDQKIETVAVRLRDTTNAGVSARIEPLSKDFLYRRLEDGLRGSEAEVRANLLPYVERAIAPVIDVGCGRGEFLLLCRERGVEARGFDTNERSVADLRARDIAADVAGVPECFASYADGSVGSILATHVVEHLPVEILFDFFRESSRVLRPGGLLMIETPNAESMLVSASEIWRDPTHLAPRHPAALVLLAREHGFTIDEARAVHPFPEGTSIPALADDPPALQRVIRILNERLFGPQDLRLIARRG
jgi:O-antigen chain-terminating methyltransferase